MQLASTTSVGSPRRLATAPEPESRSAGSGPAQLNVASEPSAKDDVEREGALPWEMQFDGSHTSKSSRLQPHGVMRPLYAFGFGTTPHTHWSANALAALSRTEDAQHARAAGPLSGGDTAGAADRLCLR